MDPSQHPDIATIEQIVDLHRIRPSVTAPEDRQRLSRVIRALRAQLAGGVPKHRAATLLGISPQALERWIRANEIPTTRTPGSSRELIDRDALIELVAEVRLMQEAGERRPVGKAIAALRERGRLRRRPLPNQPARELRYEYTHSTPAQRVRAAVTLTQTAHTMAAHARRRRRAASS